MGSEKLTFEGHSGDRLAARLDRPEGPHLATAIFAHCFTCSKDIAAARRISQRLTQAGFAVLRFDFTGLGHSDGEFANTHFSSNVGDLLAAARHLEGMGLAPDLLVGHSLGGAAVIKAAPDLASVKAVATIGAPADPHHVTANFGDHLAEIAARGKAEVHLGGRPFTIRQEFVEDVASSKLEDALRGLRRALLILHAPGDRTVGIDNATELWMAARHPKSFVTLDDADHLLSDAKDAEYAADVIASWAAKYVDLTPPAKPVGAPEGVVRTSESSPDGFLQDISAGPKHHILADEPESYGGTDLGFTPYQLLAAGLGACTSMTLRMYARRKGLNLTHVEVDVTHDKIHASDCDTCTQGEGRIDHLNRTIRLQGDLTEADRQKLLEIADKCPVHKTLETGAHVTTSLA
ncbi:bifunctional alpha/beta hydrolase/OsmC family protein [Roseobacter sp. HKCCA0434]|uniref:bifunctional alpha/beta hydrolase/OsmC family protein n=1 Tax=Roseobacter sp. HKCCA0434 TaxID=3079297 RepID=UPI0029058778|nr:bifunctional alpha/beta hydrolase/OsmC family protein [Roseobacter sp. HKCCA0434]